MRRNASWCAEGSVAKPVSAPKLGPLETKARAAKLGPRVPGSNHHPCQFRSAYASNRRAVVYRRSTMHVKDSRLAVGLH